MTVAIRRSLLSNLHLNMIELSNIVKRYGRIEALRGVSINIGDGVTGLLGPNGSGKSTLIKIMLGLLRVTTGDGKVLGIELGDRNIRQHVGYMPEDDCYIAGLTGVEVVRFAAALSGIPEVEGLRRSHEILDFCGVEQERYREVETYSTGMRQKVKFAAAIVHDPQMLILDEPTSGLDPDEREALLSRVTVLATRFNKAVLLSTHILPDVQATCNDVIIIGNGEVKLAGKLVDLNKPASPAINIRVSGDHEQMIRFLKDCNCTIVEKSKGEFSVSSQQDDLSELVWQAAKTTGSALRSVTPAINSLEEIFMSTVKETRSADS